MCVKSCLEEQILPYITLFLHLPFKSKSLYTSGEVKKTKTWDQTTLQWYEHIYSILLYLLCTNTCSYRDTLFMAIPGIFKHASLLLSEEAGDWLREFLWPMWNSSTCKSLARTHTGTHRHTPTHTTHSIYCELHISNYENSIREPMPLQDFVFILHMK